MTRTSLVIVGALVLITLGVLASVVVVSTTAPTEIAILTGVIGTVVLTVVTGLFAILQGMNNNVKLTQANAKLDTAKDTLEQTNAAVVTSQDQIAAIHNTVATVKDVLTKG